MGIGVPVEDDGRWRASENSDCARVLVGQQPVDDLAIVVVDIPFEVKELVSFELRVTNGKVHRGLTAIEAIAQGLDVADSEVETRANGHGYVDQSREDEEGSFEHHR